jgi:hypothetical protein
VQQLLHWAVQLMVQKTQIVLLLLLRLGQDWGWHMQEKLMYGWVLGPWLRWV